MVKPASKSLSVSLSEPVEDAEGRRQVLRIGSMEQVFRWVPPGVFLRGSPEGEAGRWEGEGPQHEVELRTGYWLADAPVTQALWELVEGKNPSRFRGMERPVEMVTHDDCLEFIGKVNALLPGLDLRLPTEAEWEKACRGGTTTATWAGDLDLSPDGLRAPILDPIAWYYVNSAEGTRPVRGKAPNPLGLHDMLGNVYEWCSDVYGPYEAGRQVDPRGPEEEGSRRVVRGGSWDSIAGSVRAAYRLGDDPQCRDDSLGFRLARGQQV